jgi:hypothetical protein
MLLDNSIRDPLVRAEHIDALSTDFLAGLGKRTLDDVLGDPFHRLFFGPSGSDTGGRLCHPGIAVHGIGDQLQFPLTQIPRDRFTLGELSEDIDELVHGVLAKGDPLTPTEPARQTVIEAVDKILLPINDQEEREPGRLMRS